MLAIELEGEIIGLLAEKAIYWEKEKTLIAADLHWGKTAHFRKHGIAIPVAAQHKDEMRLASIIQEKGIERLVIAGDLFHSNANSQVNSFTHFRSHHQSLHIDLVLGNHDRLQADQYDHFDIISHKKCLEIHPFCIAHDLINSSLFVLHGHIHPAMRIKSGGNNQPAVKLCCYAQDTKRMILPAFGTFTGTYLLNETGFRHIYLIAGPSVIQWK